MQTLTCILSDSKRVAFQDAIRCTFLGDLPRPIFVVGSQGSKTSLRGDIILLATEGKSCRTAEGLSKLYDFVQNQFEFDYLLVIRDDVHIQKWLLEWSFQHLKSLPRASAHYLGLVKQSKISHSEPPFFFCSSDFPIFLSATAIRVFLVNHRLLSNREARPVDEWQGYVLQQAGLKCGSIPVQCCRPSLRPSEIIKTHQAASRIQGVIVHLSNILTSRPGWVNIGVPELVRSLPAFLHESVDGIYATDLLEYLSPHDIHILLRWCCRILKTDGYLRVVYRLQTPENDLPEPERTTTWSGSELIPFLNSRGFALFETSSTQSKVIQFAMHEMEDSRELEKHSAIFLEGPVAKNLPEKRSDEFEILVVCGSDSQQVGLVAKNLVRHEHLVSFAPHHLTIFHLLTALCHTTNQQPPGNHQSSKYREGNSSLIDTSLASKFASSILSLLPPDIDSRKQGLLEIVFDPKKPKLLIDTLSLLHLVFGKKLRMIFLDADQHPWTHRFTAYLPEEKSAHRQNRYFNLRGIYLDSSVTNWDSLLDWLSLPPQQPALRVADDTDLSPLPLLEPRSGKTIQISEWPHRELTPFNSGRVAFLFLCREDVNHPEIWLEYFRGNELNYSVYCHAKYPTLVTEPLFRDAVISEHFETNWADISLVRATLAMLRQALKNPENRAFVLVSESCIPIKPLRSLRSFLRESPLGILTLSDYDSIKEWDPTKAERFKEAPFIPADKWRFHSQWFLMGRDMAEAAAQQDFTPFFEDCFAPDESYFGTILKMKQFPFDDHPDREFSTFAHWDRVKHERHPQEFVELDQTLLETLKQSESFFARKFSKGCDLSKLDLHV